MTKQEFADKVMKTYYSNNYTITEAVEVTKKELGISDSEIERCIGRDNKNEMDSSRRKLY